MNITELFIRRPVMTTLVMSGIVLFGVMGYRGLPVSDLPNVDFPTIRVSAGLPGASPETMAASVATPLERQFSTIPGIDSITSSSSRGSTAITLQFTLDRDIDAASQDVQTAIAAVLRRLPAGMPTPPTSQKINPADQPIISFTLSSQTMTLASINEYAETMVAPRVSMISGVAQVDIMGAARYAVRVQLDPNLIAARRIGIEEVQNALSEWNANFPTGTLWGARQAFTVQADGQLFNAAAFRPMVVAYRQGAPVRLEQLGQVIDSVQNDKNAAWFNNARSIAMQIYRQPGTNTVEIVDAIRRLLPEVREQMPPALKLDTIYDRSQSIRESVQDVKYTLLVTIALVILVIFLFLRNVSATAIPSLALPMSIVGTFAAMYLLGYNLDNLSLMALTLSVGFVVDDAIVMLENIVRHMELGKSRMAAALEGSREIGFTIVSMTLSLASVFIPVLFMAGIMGRLFHEFAVTIGVAILISGFVSLTLTPMLCSRFLQPVSERHGSAYLATERVFRGMRSFYRWTLDGAINHRRLTLTVGVLTLAATVVLYRQVPTGFIPSQDTGSLMGSVEFPQDASFEAAVASQQQVAAAVASNPNIDALASMVSSGVGGGRLVVRLKPRDQRTASPEDIIEELRPKLNAIGGVRTYLQNPPIIRIGGMMSRSLYQYTLQGQNLDELYRSAQDFEQRLKTLPELMDVSSDLQIASPQVKVKIDRDRAAALGLTASEIETALYNAYGSRQVSSIYAPTNDYQVIMELLPSYQRDSRALQLLHVRASGGKLVPLETVASVEPGVAALSVSHLGQLPSVTLSFNTAPGVALGDAVSAVQTASQEVLPATIHTSFQGAAAAFQSSLKGMGVLLVMALLVIYMVLGILYESFIHPLTIFSGLPSAGVGALAALLLFGNELNLYSFVGIIMLIGIVKKNAIMMIDFALEAQHEHHLAPVDAIYQACLVRFRPIMMTTMAALIGTLPIALGFGAGAEARRPLGIAVVGGLLVSQLLTLYITPVVYIYMERLNRTLGKMRRRKQPLPSEQPELVLHG
ncbi:MAG: acriflavine resistance protein B [Terriglobia bacterium]|nr:MAG: acriflavine resistance protein B [Terriglobia bacterium]